MDARKERTNMTELYTGNPKNRRDGAWRNLPPVETDRLREPSGYVTDPGAIDAVRVALTLGQPLLITGHPGCGKTLLASAVAYELGLAGVRKFETKSTSEARDLFYVFDNLGRLNAAQARGSAAEAFNFIKYNALGEAILFANPPEQVAGFFPSGFKHPGQQRSVVLIDEIDKAPRDVPNDILNEIDEMYFRVPELGNPVAAAPPEFRPIVFLTSNSEKGLPDAFLRRCVYYHMKFPDRVRLKQIVASRVAHRFSADVVEQMVTFFEEARSRGMRRAPGLAELLMWFSASERRQREPVASLYTAPVLLETARSTLFKTPEDLDIAGQMIDGPKATRAAPGG
jgi:MoxR-like ATPase